MPSPAGAGRIRAARVTRWSGALGSSQTWRGRGVRFGGRALAIGRGGASAARRAASAILGCVVVLGARALATGEASGWLLRWLGARPSLRAGSVCGRVGGNALGVALVSRRRHQATNFAMESSIDSTPPAPVCDARARETWTQNVRCWLADR
jgi:hypothetical protein